MSSTAEVPPVAVPGLAPAPPPERTRRPVRRWSRLPFVISRLLVLGALVLGLQALAPGVAWTDLLVDAYSTLVLPVDGGTVGFAIFLLILGSGLARRKQTAWVVVLVLFGVSLLGDLLGVVGLTRAATTGSVDAGALPLLARFAVNLAALSALTACLLLYRHEFSARRPPGRIRSALLTLIVGLVVTFGVALALVTLVPGALVGPRGRSGWILRQLGAIAVGSGGSLTDATVVAPPSAISTVIGVLVGLSLLAALVVLMRTQRQASMMSEAEEPRVRALVAQSSEDSLAYFATQRDRSVVFAPSGGSAVTYRVHLGVCLAAGDPLGPRDQWPGAIRAWRTLVETYGWTPAVIGASEAGATAYARAGLRVLRLGDEAVLRPRDFHLDDREMHPVRQAVHRLERRGYRTRVRRQREIPAAELAVLVKLVEAWRDAETERGFSMALGRLGDPADGECLLVEALFPPGLREERGEVAGVLSFVPWGADGFSLDVMRRHPGADNGVTELMVCAVLAAGRELGLHRVSLNFAVFRSAFEEGARIGAGPVLRLWRRLLLVASRWWQIESLYRSNVKYRPEWQPRFLCFAETRDIALVGAASGVAEGFIDLPSFLQPASITPRVPTGGSPVEPGAGALAPHGWGPGGAGLDAAAPSRGVPGVADAGQRALPQQVRQRIAIRNELVGRGVDPYPPSFRPARRLADLRLGMTTSVAGRVLAVRDLGGVVFLLLQDWSGQAQVMLTRGATGPAALGELRRVVGRGDHVGVEGTVVLSRSGEQSLEASRWLLTSKALRPPPDLRTGVPDPETRVRQPYLDLTVNPGARARLSARSRAVRAVREALHGLGYLEVETPVLQTVHGGANARPFRTHINAYDLELYLRIAPELYLKRLMVGGVDRLFEIGRNFRNEGADATHNPEFTMLEAYEAYGDYTSMRGIAEHLVTEAARAVSGRSVVQGTDLEGTRHEVDLLAPWPVVSVHDAVAAATGVEVTPDTPRAGLVALAERLQLDLDPRAGRGAVLLELYENLVERTTVRPTFYTDFPAEVSPLTRPHRRDDRLAERWDLVAFGAEIGTAYSELVDPVLQRRRLTEQSLQAVGGDPEAMELDEDFLIALEHAMPPTGGLGLGLDRLVMLLTSTSIRETITFPLVRPRGRS